MIFRSDWWAGRCPLKAAADVKAERAKERADAREARAESAQSGASDNGAAVRGSDDNAIGGIAWVTICLFAGYIFGQYQVVKENFELVIIGIIFVSVLPMAIELARGWYLKRQAKS